MYEKPFQSFHSLYTSLLSNLIAPNAPTSFKIQQCSTCLSSCPMCLVAYLLSTVIVITFTHKTPTLCLAHVGERRTLCFSSPSELLSVILQVSLQFFRFRNLHEFTKRSGARLAISVTGLMNMAVQTFCS